MLQCQFSHINPVLWFVQAGHGGLKARPFPWTFLRLGSKAWPGAELLCPGPWAAGWGRRAARLHPAQQHLSGHCLGCVSSYKLGTWHQLTPPIIWGWKELCEPETCPKRSELSLILWTGSSRNAQRQLLISGELNWGVVGWEERVIQLNTYNLHDLI